MAAGDAAGKPPRLKLYAWFLATPRRSGACWCRMLRPAMRSRQAALAPVFFSKRRCAVLQPGARRRASRGACFRTPFRKINPPSISGITRTKTFSRFKKYTRRRIESRTYHVGVRFRVEEMDTQLADETMAVQLVPSGSGNVGASASTTAPTVRRTNTTSGTRIHLLRGHSDGRSQTGREETYRHDDVVARRKACARVPMVPRTGPA